MSSYPQPPIVPPWGELAQDSGDMVQPSNTQIEAGWPESSTPPARQYFNWLFYYLSLAVNYFLQRGVADYNAAQTYAVSGVVIGDDGNLYQSLQNTNQGNTPSTSPTWWVQCGLTPAAITALIGSTFCALTGYAISLGTNGYIKLPTALGGLMIQWGTTAAFATGGSTATVTGSFATAFPTAAYSMVCSPDNVPGSPSGIYPLVCMVVSLSTSGYTIDVDTTNHGGVTITNTVHARYLAIGH